MARRERKQIGWYSELVMGPKAILQAKRAIEERLNAELAGSDGYAVISDEAQQQLQADREPDELSGDEGERELSVPR